MLMRGTPNSSGISLGVSDAQPCPTQAPLDGTGPSLGVLPEFGKGWGGVGLGGLGQAAVAAQRNPARQLQPQTLGLPEVLCKGLEEMSSEQSARSFLSLGEAKSTSLGTDLSCLFARTPTKKSSV